MQEIDLNLLMVFDTIMELRSATRAADRLAITQSAVSHALRRLRLVMDDRLFVRGPDGLQPTARAWEIAPGIHQGLTMLRGAMAPTSFDPATSDRRFTLAAGSYFCALLVPLLAETVHRHAPGVALHIVGVADDLVGELDRGLIDVAFGVFKKVPKRIVVEPLFTEEMAWIAAIGNPIFTGRVDSAILAAQPRVTISSARAPAGVGSIVSEGGLDRQTSFGAGKSFPEDATPAASTVYESQTAIAIVSRTDHVALLPRRSAFEDIARGRVAVIDTTETPPSIELSMIWHRKQREDGGLAWLRGLITAAAQAASSATT